MTPKGNDANALKALADRATDEAKNVERSSTGVVVAGPFEVGKLGHVSVVEREVGKENPQKYLYAEFTGTGRAQRIPLAAVTKLAEEMGS